MTKENCRGCRNDFYNGNNPLEVKECWSFKGAKLTRQKKVSAQAIPPHTGKPELFPNCYHADGFVMLNCKDGDRQY